MKCFFGVQESLNLLHLHIALYEERLCIPPIYIHNGHESDFPFGLSPYFGLGQLSPTKHHNLGSDVNHPSA